MPIRSSRITLHVSDGTEMEAYVSMAEDTQAHPGIIVLQEAFGVNSHIRNICDRLANDGYVAIAPEMYHRSAPAGSEFSYTDFDAVRPHSSALTVEGQTADIEAAYKWLITQSNVKKDAIGSIGFCMGGRFSFLANTLLPLNAAISFYAGGMQTLLPRMNELHAPHLFFWGGLDKHITHEHVEQVVAAMKQAGKEFTNVEISYADHGFNCDERAAYNPQAAKEAWAMTMAFFANKLQ